MSNTIIVRPIGLIVAAALSAVLAVVVWRYITGGRVPAMRKSIEYPLAFSYLLVSLAGIAATLSRSDVSVLVWVPVFSGFCFGVLVAFAWIVIREPYS